MPEMDDQEQLRELVDRWEASFRQGDALTAEELCQDRPHLLDGLRKWVEVLKSTDWMCSDVDNGAGPTLRDDADTAVEQRKAKIDRPTLGDYTLLEIIGSGGMGTVYKAIHRTMDRLVALKTLPPALTESPDALRRFRREAQAVARLSHPNIVVAHDAGEADGVHFLVMELIEGEDLARLVRNQGPLPVEEAVNCVLQAARGLEYAHGVGVIHRDIKPSNLLLDKDGTIKILDLGLARFHTAEQPTDLTGSGNVLGTIDYMAPEQAANTKHADHRADIYSLGCTLYYLLTGRPVYGGETTVERLLAHREQPIPSLQAACSGISRDLDRIFQKMVAKRPEDRFQSMGEVIRVLETCQLSPEAIFPAVLPRRWRVRPLLAVGLLGLLALLAAIIVKIRVAEGTLVLEIDQPGADVIMEGDHTVTISGTENSQPLPVDLKAGDYRLEITKRGFEKHTRRVTVVQGGREVVKIHLEPVAITPAVPQRKSGQPALEKEAIVVKVAPPPAADQPTMEREVAHWVLGVGGTIHVRSVDGTEHDVSSVTNLPSNEFRITSIFISDVAHLDNSGLRHLGNLSNLERLSIIRCPTLDDSGMAHLRGLTTLRELDLSEDIKVTGEGVKHLSGLAQLWNLSLTGTGITDAALEHLRPLKSLRRLPLERTSIGDPGLAFLADLTELRYLHLGQTKTTEAGLARLDHLTHLEALNLAGCPITDAGLEHLTIHASLSELCLDNTKVTNEGLKHLLKLPELGYLRVNGTPVTDQGMRHIARLPQLRRLWINATRVGDDGVQLLGGLNGLVELDLSGTAVTDAGLAPVARLVELESLWLMQTQISDLGLEHLKGLSKLRYLRLDGTRVSDAGVVSLRAALPNCRIARSP